MPILQVNFKLNISTSEWREICTSFAQPVADVPGLLWKIWLLNEQDMEAGGIYLFDSEQALNNYLSGPIIAQVKSHPALQDISAKQFKVMEDVTAITRGPVSAMSTAA